MKVFEASGASQEVSPPLGHEGMRVGTRRGRNASTRVHLHLPHSFAMHAGFGCALDRVSYQQESPRVKKK
eukprot:CAMPEP_0168357978 /NCGR_PEP_ID=MMETSP0228-20121227/871_1 /TAXON_ID=133427 /ORGANISM="Protoceratium reticulatum, Strain CCCM 535 (=CCMP 1889)" /LENGTH=69 /DNA_ID=CAMNT_0008370525 /DNA_START=27 /DNA_END=233 /DNA_ORIENTATION=+